MQKDALPSGGPGAVIAFVGGGKLTDQKALVEWAKAQVDRGIPILVGPGRWSPKAQTPMDFDARLIELGYTLKLPVFICPPRDDLYGDRAKEIVTLDVLLAATEIVVCGTGGKPNQAKAWHTDKDFEAYRSQIPLIEI